MIKNIFLSAILLTIATTSNASFVKMINAKADTATITAIEAASDPSIKDAQISQALNAFSGTETTKMFFGNTSGNVYVNSTPNASGLMGLFFSPSSTNEVTTDSVFLSATEWTPLADTVTIGESFVQSRDATSEITSFIRSGFSWESSVEIQTTPEIRNHIGSKAYPVNANFSLLPNGVVTCNGAIAGEEGYLDGVLYTAVDNDILHAKIGSIDASFYETACTSLVTDMNIDNYIYGGVFYDTTLNPDISRWDTSHVTDMRYMFNDADVFNSELNFDTSNVTNMSYMFYRSYKFNQPVNFDTSNVTDMNQMFQGASVFNKPLNFDTSSVQRMDYMFVNAKAFNQPLNWDTKNVSKMNAMFVQASAFNQPLNFDTSNVTSMHQMFRYASSFNQPLNFDTSSVNNMNQMFNNASSFNQTLNFNTSNVTNMRYMFSGATAFNKPLNFDTSNVTDMQAMFYLALNFNQPVNFTNTSKVIDMNYMFRDATAFNQPLSFDTSNVASMNKMFKAATNFTQDISNLCVPLISAIPGEFDLGAGFEGQSNIQPVWGTCPI